MKSSISAPIVDVSSMTKEELSMNCMQSAEEAYKGRVGKYEYNFVMEELNRSAFFIEWDDFSHKVEKIVKNHLKEINEQIDEEHISRAWKETIWIEEVNLNDLFADDLHFASILKQEMNKYLSDEDIKHRYYEFFSHLFKAAMDFLEDEKNGLTKDDEEEIDDLLRDDEEDESTKED